MPGSRLLYPAEFRLQMVELGWSGHGPDHLGRELRRQRRRSTTRWFRRTGTMAVDRSGGRRCIVCSWPQYNESKRHGYRCVWGTGLSSREAWDRDGRIPRSSGTTRRSGTCSADGENPPQRTLGWWGTMTAVVFGNLVAWAIATAVVLILWIGACGLAFVRSRANPGRAGGVAVGAAAALARGSVRQRSRQVSRPLWTTAFRWAMVRHRPRTEPEEARMEITAWQPPQPTEQETRWLGT